MFEHNALPPLTSLVAIEKNDLPSGGFTEAIDIFRARSRVLVFDWSAREHGHHYANLADDAGRDGLADHWDSSLLTQHP